MEKRSVSAIVETQENVAIIHQGMPFAIPVRRMRDRSEARYEIGDSEARRQHGVARRAQREATEQALGYFSDISGYFPMGGIGAAVAAKRKGELAYQEVRNRLVEENGSEL